MCACVCACMICVCVCVRVCAVRARLCVRARACVCVRALVCACARLCVVMCYKIYNNLVDLPFESFFTKPARPYSIRGHPCILRSKHLPHHAFRAHFFTERVIPIWNHLPQDVVTSLNITVFRTRLRSVDLSPYCMLYPSHV